MYRINRNKNFVQSFKIIRNTLKILFIKETKQNEMIFERLKINKFAKNLLTFKLRFDIRSKCEVIPSRNVSNYYI